MENILLLTVLAATFGFGFLVVKRLDGAMDKREASLRASPYEKRLRVGYSDPRITGSLSESLMRYTRKNPETAVSLFDGTQAELMQALSERKLDLVVLPEGMVMEQQSEVCTEKGTVRRLLRNMGFRLSRSPRERSASCLCGWQKRPEQRSGISCGVWKRHSSIAAVEKCRNLWYNRAEHPD